MKASLDEAKPKIFIVGDSWGCGEWAGEPASITHKGLEQYLTEIGYTIINLSQGGKSIKYCINQLRLQQTKPNDIVLFIQTDPLRNLSPYSNLTDAIKTSGGVKNLANQILLNSYEQLDAIARQNQLRIYLIGGLFNIIPHEFNYVNTAVKSWINLLVGDFKEYSHSINDDFGVSASDWGIDNIHLSTYNKDLAMRVTDEVYEYHCNGMVFREDIFRPDGVHPNRMGHKILFDYIYENILKRT